MNPIFVRLGIGLAATVCYIVYQIYNTKKQRRHEENHNYRPSENYDGSNQTMCLICLEELNAFTSVKLPCNHKFHKKCIKTVFLNEPRNSRSCPLCRKVFNDSQIDHLFELGRARTP